MTDEDVLRINAELAGQQVEQNDNIAAMSDELLSGNAVAAEGSILGKDEQGQEAIPNILSGKEPDSGYADFNFPEETKVDKGLLKSAVWQFKKLGLTQEQAQGMVDMSTEVISAIAGAQQRDWDKMTAAWAHEVRNDPELGGYNYHQTIAQAERVLKRFDRSGTLTDFLITTKAGNHPALIRFLVNIDSIVAEDGFERGGRSQPKKEFSDADIFYPHN